MSVYSTLAPDSPKENVGGRWEICTPESAGGFSGVAYFFAPGTVSRAECSDRKSSAAHGAARPIQAWTRREILLQNPVDQQYIEEKETAEKNFSKEAAQQEIETWKQNNSDKHVPGWIKRKLLSPSETTHYPQKRCTTECWPPLIPYAIRGVIWYQGEASGERQDSQPLLSLGRFRI